MQTNEDLMSALIKKAKSGERIQFQFLRSWREYITTRKIQRAHALLVASMAKSANKLFKSYCKDIVAGDSDTFKLLAYRTAVDVLDFYKEELEVLSDMTEEYEYYLFYGNWADFVLGLTRTADKLWDHRGK